MDELIDAIGQKTAFLDTIGARVLAIVIAAVAGYFLMMSHQHYSGTAGGILGGVDRSAFDACIDGRIAAFEKLASQANYDDARRAAAEQAARSSAGVICAEQVRPPDGV